jgi:hypothetical protein
VDLELSARVDALLAKGREEYLATRDKPRHPQKAHGKHLLSGGMLLCPTCGGHFEARHGSSSNRKGIYVCSTRRNKPGACSNRLVLGIKDMDEVVLQQLEGELIGERYIQELLALVDEVPDQGERLTAEIDRLKREVSNLVETVAAVGVSETAVQGIKTREAEIAKLEVALRRPQAIPVNKAKLRAALEQRTKEWREALRAEPKVARLLLRRLIGPITLWEWEPTPEVPDYLRKYIGEGLPDHMVPPGMRKLHWSQIPGAIPSPNEPEPQIRWEADLKPEGALVRYSGSR